MSYSATYSQPIFENHKTSVFADVEYSIEPSGGDGWDEPRYNAVAVIESVTLYAERNEDTWIWDATSVNGVRKVSRVVREDLGAAPKWVVSIIEDDTDWLLEIAAEEECDDRSDYIRDSRRDLELTEGR